MTRIRADKIRSTSTGKSARIRVIRGSVRFSCFQFGKFTRATNNQADSDSTDVKQQQLFGPEPLPWELADQEDLVCAQLVFNRPVDRAFDYLVPDPLRGQLQVGQRVQAPFGRGDRLAIGYCVGLEKPNRPEGLKTIH